MLEQAAQAKRASALTIDSPAALEAFEKEALAKLPGFVAIAPAAIKGDLEVLVAADHKLYDALAAAHFDMRKVNPTAMSELETPEFTKATEAIGNYLSKTCGISSTQAP